MARHLNEQELAIVLKNAPAAERFGQFLMLLILTGQRYTQIATLHNEYIDRSKRLIHFPPPTEKHSKGYVIPYGTWADTIINPHCPDDFVI